MRPRFRATAVAPIDSLPGQGHPRIASISLIHSSHTNLSKKKRPATFFIYMGGTPIEGSDRLTTIDARVLEKELDFLETFELREAITLTYQPPPIVIVLEPGMGYEHISEQFKQKAYEASRNGLSSMLSQCDDTIRKRRKRGFFHNEHLESRKVASWCGEVSFRRRAYTDREGNNRYLSDEVLGLDKGQRVSLHILLRALICAGEMSYAKVKELIECWTGLKRSPETCRRWVLRVGDYIQTLRKEKCAQIFEKPSSYSEDFRKDPDFLMLEADGCHIYMRIPTSLDEELTKDGDQAGKGSVRKASAKKEIRLGLWYEGKRPRRGTEGNGQYEVTGKTYFGGLMKADEFWETAAMMGQERYGLGPLTEVFGGGDGANWIGPSIVEEFQKSLFILCRYHWKRDIFRLFPGDEGKDLVRYVEANNKESACGFIEKQLTACAEEKSKTKKILDLKKYLLNQWDSIQSYCTFKKKMSDIAPALLRMGVIEGHIYQVLYLRFESRGGYWSEDGLNALLHVLMAELNGNLAQFLRIPDRTMKSSDTVTVEKKESVRKKKKTASPCVEGSFPYLKRPMNSFNSFLKRLAHPEREKAA
jgi:hypothetical protein